MAGILVQDAGLRFLDQLEIDLDAEARPFRNMDEAVAGVNAIRSDYPHHARAARELAEAYFDSNRVLTQLLDRIGA